MKFNFLMFTQNATIEKQILEAYFLYKWVLVSHNSLSFKYL